MAENHHPASAQPPQRLARAASALLLFLLVAGFFWKLVLTNQFTWLAGADIASQVLPWYQFQASEFHAGRFPFWDPNQALGQPLLAQAQPGTAYPLNWLLFSLPLRQGWIRQSFLHWYFVLIHWMAAALMYRFSRDLRAPRPAAIFAGLVFALAGYMGSYDWPQMLNGALWGPAVLMFLFRVARGHKVVQSSVLGGFCLGLAWLAGHHQVPLYLSLIAGFGWLFLLAERVHLRRRLAGLAAFWSMTAATGAFLFLPTLEYARRSVRWVGLPDPVGWGDKVPVDIHRHWTFEPSALLGIVLPGFFANVEPFLGVTAFTLALLGVALAWERRETRWLAAIGVAGVVYSLSDSSFLHGWLYSMAPLVDKARNPGTAIYVFHLAASALAAVGAAAALEFRLSPWLKHAARACLVFGAAIFALRAGQALLTRYNAGGDQRPFAVALASLLLAGLFLWIRRGDFSRPVVCSLFIALFFLEAGQMANNIYLPSVKEEQRIAALLAQGRNANLAEFLRRQPQPLRFETEANDVPFNFGDWHGLSAADGYLAGKTQNVFRLELHTAPTKRLLGVEYLLASKPTEFHQELVLKGSHGLNLYRNPAVNPRAWVVHEVLSVPHAGHIAPTIADPQRDWRRAAFVVGPAPKVESCAGDEPVVFRAYDSGRVSLSARLQCAGFLVLTDTWYPGWRATVDGRETPIHEAYGALRGVVVPAGAHTVEFRYRP
jgi:hypothetical protein